VTSVTDSRVALTPNQDGSSGEVDARSKVKFRWTPGERGSFRLVWILWPDSMERGAIHCLRGTLTNSELMNGRDDSRWKESETPQGFGLATPSHPSWDRILRASGFRRGDWKMRIPVEFAIAGTSHLHPVLLRLWQISCSVMAPYDLSTKRESA